MNVIKNGNVTKVNPELYPQIPYAQRITQPVSVEQSRYILGIADKLIPVTAVVYPNSAKITVSRENRHIVAGLLNDSVIRPALESLIGEGYSIHYLKAENGELKRGIVNDVTGERLVFDDLNEAFRHFQEISVQNQLVEAVQTVKEEEKQYTIENLERLTANLREAYALDNEEAARQIRAELAAEVSEPDMDNISFIAEPYSDLSMPEMSAKIKETESIILSASRSNDLDSLSSAVRERDVLKAAYERAYNAYIEREKENKTNGSGVQQESAKTEKSFEEQVDDVLAGKAQNNYDNSIKLSDTPDVLLKLGFEKLPMLYSKQHLLDAVKPKTADNPHAHGLTREQILAVPELLKEPVCIFDSISPKPNNSVVAILCAVDNDRSPIFVSIKPNGKGIYQLENISANYTTSIYGKDNNFTGYLERVIKSGNLLYVDKEKVEQLSSLLGLQLSLRFDSLDFANLGSRIIIHQSRNIVKSFSDNSRNVSVDDAKAEQSSDISESTGKKSKNGKYDIIGNTKFRFVPDKTRTDPIPNDEARQELLKRIENVDGLKYSGRTGDDIVLTVNGQENKELIESIYRSVLEEQGRIISETQAETPQEKTFAEQIYEVLHGTPDRFQNIKVCDTPKLLQDVGCDDLPMLYTQSHLKKAVAPKDRVKHQHGLTEEFLAIVPELMADPVMVLDSLTRDDSLLVVLSSKDTDPDNSPIVASVFPNGEGKYEMQLMPSNFVTSIYGRDDFDTFIERCVAEDKILYANKEKSQELFSVLRLEFPQGFNNLDFNTIIHQSRNIVKRSDDNISANEPVRDEQYFLEQAKNAINGFCVSEYSSEADFSDMSNVNIAYTTVVEIDNKPLDEELELQVSVDLENYAINSYVDGDLLHSEKYDSIEDMLSALNNLDFNELTSTIDYEEEIQSMLADKQAERAIDINEALADPVGSPEEKAELQRELDSEHINDDGQVSMFENEEIAEDSSKAKDNNLLLSEIQRGTGFVHGKFRVQDFYEEQHPTVQQLADFLKKEYGIGGHSGEGNVFFTDHDSRGISFVLDSGEKINYSWHDAAETAERLLRNNTYLSDREKAEREELNATPSEDGLAKRVLEFFDHHYQHIDEYAEQDKQTAFSIGDRFIADNPDIVGRIVTARGESFDSSAEVSALAFALADTGIISRFSGYTAEKEQTAPVRGVTQNQPTDNLSTRVDKSTVKSVNYRSSPDDVHETTPKKRFAANAEAIKTLKAIEKEGRTATPEEQKILAGYTGWGGLTAAFEMDNPSWANEYAKLQGLLTDEEYANARATVLDAFYTSNEVISAIYSALDKIGFKGGSILEPSMGVGNFFGMLPESMQGSKLTGVEIDDLTGRIAKQLYPQAEIHIKGLQETNLRNNSFDVAVGNVPFGETRIYDRDHRNENFLIHDYFFAKALDKVHPGGVVAFITSKGTMDKDNPEVREYLSRRAEFVGAVRLPNNAFTGTQTATDIIFLKKRERELSAPDKSEWIYKKGDTENAYTGQINEYFVQHPEMICGRLEEVSTRFGSDIQCVSDGRPLSEHLERALSALPGNIFEHSRETAASAEDVVLAPADANKFEFYNLNGILYYRDQSDYLTKAEVYNPKLKPKQLERALALIELRDVVRELLDLQLNNSTGAFNADIDSTRQKLNDLYDKYVKDHGNISSEGSRRSFRADDSYPLLCSLENKNSDGMVTGKSDIFFKNTVSPKQIIDHVDTAEDALALSVAEKGRVDFEYMTEVSGIPKESLIEHLKGQIYRLPSLDYERYVTADEYLSGNIRNKIRQLDAFPDGIIDKEAQRKALEDVLPARIEAADIKYRLGATWIPAEYLNKFICEHFEPDVYSQSKLESTYSKAIGEWKIDNVEPVAKRNVAATNKYGTERMNAYEILERILNSRQVIVKDYAGDDENGKPIYVVNEEQTKLAKQKEKLINNAFNDWLFKDRERRERLVDRYNELFNSIRPREYDGAKLHFEGMNPEIKLEPHQLRAIARAIYNDNAYFAHAVGAGKTFEMIATAMEKKRLGLCKKSLIAVPNALTAQVGADFRKLYPTAKILVATEKDFETKNRKMLLAKMAVNDYDAVIVGHTQFDRMGLSPEKEKEYINKELDDMREALVAAKYAARAKGHSDKQDYSVRGIERTIKALEERLKKANDRIVKDSFIDFEHLGFDQVFIDEADLYKNLDTPTKMSNVAGVGTKGSSRAMGLLMKSKYLGETGGGLVLASGTPISNSMTELYTIMRYLQQDMLRDMGIERFDEWAKDFGDVVVDWELKPESNGTFQLRTRFSQFTNLPELMTAVKENMDIITSDQLTIDKPKKNTHNVVAKPSKEQRRAVKKLGKRAERIRGGGVDPKDDNMLCITNDGRKIGLDMRLINPKSPDNPDSKVNLCVRNVLDIFNKTAEKRSTQLIFCDMSTPKPESRCNNVFVYRKTYSEDSINGYEMTRKMSDVSRNDLKYDKIVAHIGKEAQTEEDNLKDGDIVVIRKPSEDMKTIISEPLVFQNGELLPIEQPEADMRLEEVGMTQNEPMPPKPFNVYDDIKSKLIAQGVPENEIAFIHDYDTAEKKKQLYDKMNEGEVRILLGSTSKCGAGMNAQKKMCAIHHLDMPLRPRDLEQRDGRGERRGNENKEIDVFRYITEDTFDAYLAQIVENKLKFIGQIMTSKMPQRVAEDIDDAVMEIAAVKALAQSNPLIREEMTLRSEIADLTLLKNAHKQEIYSLQNKLESMPKTIEHYSEIAEGYRTDHQAANAESPDEETGTYPVTIMDKTYDGKDCKKEAGTALYNAIMHNIKDLHSWHKVPVGTYRGMELSVKAERDFFSLSGDWQYAYKGVLKGKSGCEYNFGLNLEGAEKGDTSRTTRNITAMDKLIDGFKENAEKYRSLAENGEKDIEKIRAELDKPFTEEGELEKKEARLVEVRELLTTMSIKDDKPRKDLFERLCDTFPAIMEGDAYEEEYSCILPDIREDSIKLYVNGDTLTLDIKKDVKSLLINPAQEIKLKLDFENKSLIPYSFKNGDVDPLTIDPDAEIVEDTANFINNIVDRIDDMLDDVDDAQLALVYSDPDEYDLEKEEIYSGSGEIGA